MPRRTMLSLGTGARFHRIDSCTRKPMVSVVWKTDNVTGHPSASLEEAYAWEPRPHSVRSRQLRRSKNHQDAQQGRAVLFSMTCRQASLRRLEPSMRGQGSNLHHPGSFIRWGRVDVQYTSSFQIRSRKQRRGASTCRSWLCSAGPRTGGDKPSHRC